MILSEMPLTLDASKQGLEMFFKPYQVEALRVLWKAGSEGGNSKLIWEGVNESFGISRAAIIQFLNAMVDEELMEYDLATGKGGQHRVYRMELSMTGLSRRLAEIFTGRLIDEYPDETRLVIKNIM